MVFSAAFNEHQIHLVVDSVVQFTHAAFPLITAPSFVHVSKICNVVLSMTPHDKSVLAVGAIIRGNITCVENAQPVYLNVDKSNFTHY